MAEGGKQPDGTLRQFAAFADQQLVIHLKLRQLGNLMNSSPFNPYALAKIIAGIKADADHNRPTDVSALADELLKDLPGLSHQDIVTHITNAVAAVNAHSATHKSGELN